MQLFQTSAGYHLTSSPSTFYSSCCCSNQLLIGIIDSITSFSCITYFLICAQSLGPSTFGAFTGIQSHFNTGANLQLKRTQGLSWLLESGNKHISGFSPVLWADNLRCMLHCFSEVLVSHSSDLPGKEPLADFPFSPVYSFWSSILGL